MNGFIFWKDVLGRVKAANGGNFTNAVVAGGCVRDYMLGIEPKDIDVFVRANPATAAVPEGFEDVNLGEDRPEYHEMNGIRGVHDYRYQNTAINVVFIDDSPFTYVEDSFDSRINQGAVGSKFMELPAAMMEDIERKRYTIHQMGPNSMARGERFMQKIAQVEQGWTLVVEDNEHNQRFQQPRLVPMPVRAAQAQPIVDPVWDAWNLIGPGGVINEQR